MTEARGTLVLKSTFHGAAPETWISEPACRAAPSSVVQALDPWGSPWLQPPGEIFLEPASNRSHPHGLSLSRSPSHGREPTSFRVCHTSPRVEPRSATPG